MIKKNKKISKTISNIEISIIFFNPELQLKDTESAIKSKLKELLINEKVSNL